MKKQLIIAGLFLSGSLYAQQNVELVTPANKTPNSLIYSLPKTGLKIQVEIKKTIEKAGPFAKQANKQFGLDDSEVIFNDNAKYEIAGVKASTQGFADPSKSYKVTAAANSKANLIQLNENGVILAVNASLANIPSKEKTTTPKGDETPALSFNKSDLPEEFFAADFDEQVTLATTQIYKIRETQMDLLSGFVDNIPADAPTFQLMLDELKRKENNIMELFKGKSITVTEYKTLELVPAKKTKGDPLFYFSPSNGFTADNKKGEPCYISLQSAEKTIATQALPAKANVKNGFYYCVPENINVEIYTKEKVFYQQNIPIAQFGTTVSLPVNFIEKNNASILFDPITGTVQMSGQK